MKPESFLCILLFAANGLLAGEPPLPHFRATSIDTSIQIGYGITVADVDGDHKPDILLVDKKQIVWYRNPGWEKFVIAENLTVLDDVCIAADIDGDGKAEVAVGGAWNPSDTVNSGAVFYLLPPADRTQKWEPIELPHEPTVHRMRWMRNGAGGFDLVVVPLHGRGNKDGQGTGVKILCYRMPADPHASWKTELVSDSLHLTHNLDLLDWSRGGPELLVAGKEGVFHFTKGPTGWNSQPLAGGSGATDFKGAGEVRHGKLPGGRRFVATIEPMHGEQLVVYVEPKSGPGGSLPSSVRLWERTVIDSTLKEGHALACGDLLGASYDQIVVGWRAKDKDGKVGIKLFIPLDPDGHKWSQTVLDDNTMACEDLCLADLNGDGKLEVVASGRATRNVKIYWNLGP